ncbi:MAG: clostripain-related cysteine peptidase [Acetatifactor sp.]
MAFCNKCGVENEEGAQFCRRCGGAMRPLEPEKKKSGKKKGILIAVISILVLALGTGGFLLRDTIAESFSSMAQKSDKETREDRDEKEPEDDGEDDKDDEDEPEETKEKKPEDDPEEEQIAKRTLMLYVIGSNLEYDYNANGKGYKKGLASMDIEEILDADYSEDLNIIIQTGGTVQWKNKNIKGGVVQRFRVGEDGLEEIENLGKICMTNKSTLSDFIQFSKENYPAEEYVLVFWDHGGGVPNGFGVDDLFPGKMLTDVELGQALKDGGVHFDAVIFNACLMCSLEVYMSICDYTDYAVAAESVVTGTVMSMIGSGFEYTNFVNHLGNPDNTIVGCCESLLDDYMGFLQENNWFGTMTIMRMNRVKEVYKAYEKYISVCYEKLKAGGYNEVIQARAACGDFDGYDFVDLNTLAYKYENQWSTDLQNAISNAIEVTESYGYSNGRGITAYFPYELCYLYDQGRSSFVQLNYSDSIIGFYDLLASKNLFYAGQTEYAGDWYIAQADDTQVAVQENDTQENEVGEYLLLTNEEGGKNVIELTEEDWDIIVESSIRKMVAYEYDDEYLHYLGKDDTYTYDDSGNLTMEVPDGWLRVNDLLPTSEVVYTLSDDESYYCEFMVYAYVDDAPAMILVTMTDSIDNMSVLGYFPCDDSFENYDQGYYFEGTEKISLVVKAYEYASDSIVFREYTDKFTSDELYVAYEALDLSEFEASYVQYRFDDTYGNSYYTEYIEAK